MRKKFRMSSLVSAEPIAKSCSAVYCDITKLL